MTTALTDIYATANHWSACDLYPGGSPYRAERLATGAGGPSQSISLSTDALTAHVEATLRCGCYYGYIVEASPRQDYMAEECRLILRFFSEHGRGAVVSAGSPSEASVRRDNRSQVEWARPHARWRYPALLPSRRASKRVRGPG